MHFNVGVVGGGRERTSLITVVQERFIDRAARADESWERTGGEVWRVKACIKPCLTCSAPMVFPLFPSVIWCASRAHLIFSVCAEKNVLFIASARVSPWWLVGGLFVRLWRVRDQADGERWKVSKYVCAALVDEALVWVGLNTVERAWLRVVMSYVGVDTGFVVCMLAMVYGVWCMMYGIMIL